MKITEHLKRGDFVVTGEVGPPKGCHPENLLHEAEEYLRGVTAINVTDSQSSKMRMGSLATCIALKERGFEPVFSSHAGTATGSPCRRTCSARLFSASTTCCCSPATIL